MPPAETPPVEIVTPEAPVVVPPVKVEAAVAEVQNADSWELKYRALNGKYIAEVPRLAQQLREANEALRIAQTASPAKPAEGEETPPAGTPQSVIDQYGEDFAAAVTTVAQAQTKPLRDELSSKVERLDAEAGERRRQDFLRDLSTHVPNWGRIDQDPGFTAYLDDFDAQTGKTRREFFNEADASNNAPRVASFFAAFANGNQPRPAPTPAPAAPAPPSVEHLIAPDSSRHSEAPEGKKHWTRAEVAKFYADARAQGGNKPYGRYSAADYARIDADISAAPGENRYSG